MRLYFVVKQLSVWLRGLLFANLIEQLNISDNILINYAISFAASYVIHFITYGAVGLFYSKGEEPTRGSAMYFAAYVNYTFWTWLGLKCYIAAAVASSFVGVLLYLAIGIIVIANIVGLALYLRFGKGGRYQ